MHPSTLFPNKLSLSLSLSLARARSLSPPETPNTRERSNQGTVTGHKQAY